MWKSGNWHYTMGATRSFTTRVPGKVLPATGSPSDPKPAGFFGPGSRVPVKQRVPVVSMSDNNLQKPFKHAANDPAHYSHIPNINSYQACSYNGHP